MRTRLIARQLLDRPQGVREFAEEDETIARLTLRRMMRTRIALNQTVCNGTEMCRKDIREEAFVDLRFSL